MLFQGFPLNKRLSNEVKFIDIILQELDCPFIGFINETADFTVDFGSNLSLYIFS